MSQDVAAEQVSLFNQDMKSGKTCPEHLVRVNRTARTSVLSSKKQFELRIAPCQYLDLRPGYGNLLGASWESNTQLLGEWWTLNTGVSPSAARVSTLSQILEVTPHRKYYLSKTACLGILRRARERGKELPPVLKRALEIQAGIVQPDTTPNDVEAFHINQRNGVEIPSANRLLAGSQARRCRFSPFPKKSDDFSGTPADLGGVSGALMATSNMQMQTFVTQPEDADCLTPWDVQSKRIFSTDGVSHTLSSVNGGGDVFERRQWRMQREKRSGSGGSITNEVSEATIAATGYAFAENQRCEVRDLGEVSAALCTTPSSKQQTMLFAAGLQSHSN